METCTIVGSPNWYLSQVLDCSWDNRIAYGSLTSIVVVDPSQILNPMTLNHAHSSRVLSVSFPPEGFGNKLVSTSESGETYVWNLDTLKVSLALKNPQRCPTYGSWLNADGNLIVCVDENGNLLQWKVDSNVVSIKAFKEHTFVVLASCPHSKDLVATGTKQGLVCIINIKGKECILHKLRGHDSEVVSLSWCPTTENVIGSKNKNDCFLLASGAREKRIFFWRAGQDGLYEAYIDMPLAPRIQGAKLWTCVNWYEPQHLLASSIAGEVYSINVSKLKSKKGSEKGQSWERFSDHHNRGHVVVKSRLWQTEKTQSAADWRLRDHSTKWVWTFGSDRVVYGIPLEKQNAVIKLNTIGGPVNTLSISPIDGTSMAIGVADKSIRVVNLSEPNLKTMRTYDQKVSAKVMSLSWHPSKDGWLAYGTADGRIGIHFTCAVKLPILFRPFTKDSIYALEWGPSLALIRSKETSENIDEKDEEMKTSRHLLYAIGGGRIAALDPNHYDEFFEEPFKDVLKLVLKPENAKSKNRSLGLTDLAWKPDFTLLALGDETGSVHLLYLTSVGEFQLASSFKVHSSLIQDLAWHPTSCTSDKDGDSLQICWLASASNDVSIRVVDTTAVHNALKNPGGDISLPVSDVPCIATLKGHKLRVSKLAWSPHEGGRLLSVSYDQCAQVWDVINRQPIACFTQHSAPLYSCLWSPFNSDIAITAGHDGTVCLWGVPDQKHKIPITKSKDGKHILEDAKDARILTTVGVENHSTNGVAAGESTSQKPKKRREKALLPLSGPDVLKDECNLTILRFLLNPGHKNLTYDLNVEEDNGHTLPLHYAFFGDQPALEQYLMKESKNVTPENSFTLDLWRGSVKEAIAEAIQTKSLNDYIVSIAPSVSHKTWSEACAAYADQLKDAHEFSKASAYLLAIHRVKDAITLLADQGKYRHALAVARCRLSEDDPVIKDLLISWAEENASQGRYCLSAVCYASAGNWDKAARCLANKKCVERLLLASQIMKEKSTDQETGIFYARECFDIGLLQKDWHSIKLVLNMYQSLDYLTLRAYVHENICALKDKIMLEEWLLQNVNKTELACVEDYEGEPIVLSENQIFALQRDLVNEVTVSNESTAWLAASSKVTLAFLSAPKLFPRIIKRFSVRGTMPEDVGLEDAYRSLVQALALLYHFHITDADNDTTVPILLKLCVSLAPEGPFELNSLFAPSPSPLQGSLRAYLAAGLLMWLSNEDSNNPQITSAALEAIETLKSDIFSLDSLKWFKVEFRLKILQDSKVSKLLKEKKENGEQTCKNQKEESTDLSKACENAPQVLTEPTEVCKSPEELEIDSLSSWLHDFSKRREKLPNPYLSYSNLIQCIKTLRTVDEDSSELLEKYAKYWDNRNSLLDD